MSPTSPDFQTLYSGYTKGVLRWPRYDQLIAWLREHNNGWYIYQTDTSPPETPATAEELIDFLDTIGEHFRALHGQPYCGYVYVDDFDQPNIIKIYHPKNMGSSCSAGGKFIPAIILTQVPPDNVSPQMDEATANSPLGGWLSNIKNKLGGW